MNVSRIELAIGGMTCSVCVRHVTHALNDVANVDKVEVDLAAKRAVVYALAGAQVTGLVAAVEEAGYTAQPIADAASKEACHD